MDFFAPSDHDMRVDFSPVVEDMGAHIGTAPGAEVTTFDYGHFNFWPMAIETDRSCDDFLALFGGSCAASGHSAGAKMSRGATDWGGQAPLGQDFPSAGHYSRTPQEILDSAAVDPRTPGRRDAQSSGRLTARVAAPIGNAKPSPTATSAVFSVMGGASAACAGPHRHAASSHGSHRSHSSRINAMTSRRACTVCEACVIGGATAVLAWAARF